VNLLGGMVEGSWIIDQVARVHSNNQLQILRSPTFSFLSKTIPNLAESDFQIRSYGGECHSSIWIFDLNC